MHFICLKQDKVSFTHETVVIFLIFYTLDIGPRDLHSILEAFSYYACT